eukprot:Colp12_sorted_trinity150504_noHs@21399
MLIGFGDMPHQRRKKTTKAPSTLQKNNGVEWRLSDEILLAIFKLLKRKHHVICAQVCKEWRRIAYDPSLWRAIQVNNWKTSFPYLQAVLEQRPPELLQLVHCKVEPKSCRTRGTCVFSTIKVIDLSSTTIHATDLSLLAKCTPKAVRVNLQWCNTNFKRFVDCLCIYDTWHELLELSLKMCILEDPKDLVTLIRMCPKLKKLSIEWLNHGKTVGDPELKQIAELCPYLEDVNVSGCAKLTDNALVNFAKSCPKLKALDLSDCIQLTDKAMHALRTHCQDLQSISINRCGLVTPAAILPLARLPKLTTLNVIGCYSLNLPQLKAQFPNLKINTCLLSAF